MERVFLSFLSLSSAGLSSPQNTKRLFFSVKIYPDNRYKIKCQMMDNIRVMDIIRITVIYDFTFIIDTRAEKIMRIIINSDIRIIIILE
jgi:hypothetical protein